MSVDPKDQVGLEKHKTRTQFVYVIQGRGTSVLGDEEFNIYPGVGFIVPKNTYHNIINTSSKVPLKFFTTYSPKEHKYDERVKHNPRK